MKECRVRLREMIKVTLKVKGCSNKDTEEARAQREINKNQRQREKNSVILLLASVVTT